MIGKPDGGVARGPSMIRRITLLSAVFVVLLTGLGAARLTQVHGDYGVWALVVGARTPRLPYGGRVYRLGTSAGVPDGGVPAGMVRLGVAPGDGIIYGPAAWTTPTVLWIRYPDGRVAHYDLSGGP